MWIIWFILSAIVILAALLGAIFIILFITKPELPDIGDVENGKQGS